MTQQGHPTDSKSYPILDEFLGAIDQLPREDAVLVRLDIFNLLNYRLAGKVAEVMEEGKDPPIVTNNLVLRRMLADLIERDMSQILLLHAIALMVQNHFKRYAETIQATNIPRIANEASATLARFERLFEPFLTLSHVRQSGGAHER